MSDEGFYELAMVEKKKRTSNIFLRYCLVGVCNTISSYVIYLFFCNVLRVSAYLSYYLGFTFGVVVAFILQWKYVFVVDSEERKNNWFSAFLKVYCTYLFTSFILGEFCLYIWFEVIHVSHFLGGMVRILGEASIVTSTELLSQTIAPFFCALITIPVGYFLNKNWSYKDRNTRWKK